jgi:hypothetical protein
MVVKETTFSREANARRSILIKSEVVYWPEVDKVGPGDKKGGRKRKQRNEQQEKACTQKDPKKRTYPPEVEENMAWLQRTWPELFPVEEEPFPAEEEL